MNIKKVVAGGLATLGATLALIGAGMAATSLNEGLQPYVKITDTTLSSPWIVIGRNADAMDVVGAADLAASLVSNYAVVEKTVPSSGATTSVADGVLIKSAKDYVWFSSNAKFSSVKQTVTDSDLPELLKKGTVEMTDGSTVKYQQLIYLGNHYVEYNDNPEDYEEPVLNVKFNTSTEYNLTVIFLGGLDTSKIDTTTEIELFGKKYKFGPNPSTSNMTLYSQTGSQTITIGNTEGLETSATVTVDGTDYTITFLGWDPNNTNTASIKIEYNGNSMTKSWSESGTYTLPGSSTQIYVNRVDVVATGAQEQSGSVELFVGTDKLEIISGREVEKNGETLDYTNVTFDVTGSKINSITFQVVPEEDTYLVDGGEFVDPVFGSFKFKLSGMTPGLTDSSRDVVKFARNGDNKVKLTFTNDDGTEYNVDVIYYDSDSGSFKLGDGSKTLHVVEANVSNTSDTGWISKYEYFAVQSGEKSYIMKFTNIDEDNNLLKFQDIGTGTEYEVSYTGTDEPKTGTLIIGAAQFDIKYNTSSDKLAVDLNDDDSIDGGTSADVAYLVTKTNGRIDLSAVTTNNKTKFTEYKLYTIGDYEPSNQTLEFTVSWDSSASEIGSISAPSGTTSSGQVGSENIYHYLTPYGTYIVRDRDSDSVTIYYPGERPAHVNVAIGTDPKFTTTSTTAGTYNEAVPVTNPIAKFPSEVSQDSTLDKDLILVGGPCANDIVKTLLNEAWNTSDSCDYWLNQDDVLKNGGNGLIKVVEDVFGSGHKALIVAGTNAEDTRALIANYVIKPSKMSTLTGDEYKGPVA